MGPMVRKPKPLPHPSTLMEITPDDEILFRERYRSIKSMVYDLEDENNLIAYKSAQVRRRISAMREEITKVEVQKRQEETYRLERERSNQSVLESNQRPSISSMKSNSPLPPPPTTNHRHSTSSTSVPPNTTATPYRHTPPPHTRPNIVSWGIDNDTSQSGASASAYTENGNGNGNGTASGHTRNQGSIASVTTSTSQSGFAGLGPAIGSNGEEDELMDDDDY